jgi:hypothetical protein
MPRTSWEGAGSSKAREDEFSDFRHFRETPHDTFSRIGPHPHSHPRAAMSASCPCAVVALACRAAAGVTPCRRARRATVARASTKLEQPACNEKGMYDGTVLFHVFPQLTPPTPIFSTFLEGALHVAEVAKSHPAYATAHFHEAHDSEKALRELPHGYLAMTLFSCAPEVLWTTFEDLKECLDIGHNGQTHHPLVCRETSAFPGPKSALAQAPHGKVRYAETDATVVVVINAGTNDDVEKSWTEWSGAEEARRVCGDESFLGATLHTCIDTEAKYTHVVRVELGNADDETVEAVVRHATTRCAKLVNGTDQSTKLANGDSTKNGFVVEAYRVAFNVEKKGTPAGALFAVRELQKKARENEKEKVAFEAKAAAKSAQA